MCCRRRPRDTGGIDRGLADLRVRCAWRMKASEKEAVMTAFKAVTSTAVATTVIEVGVDVPNASLMIIENAERLGLSQLHQLRGRSGAQRESACVLRITPVEPARAPAGAARDQ